MYERKIPEDFDCGIVITMKILGGKWQPCIIDALNRGVKRPSELHRQIGTASSRVINMQLRELEDFKIISKKIYPGIPLKVEYYLTELGKSILPIINAMNEWGDKNRNKIVQLNFERDNIYSIQQKFP